MGEQVQKNPNQPKQKQEAEPEKLGNYKQIGNTGRSIAHKGE